MPAITVIENKWIIVVLFTVRPHVSRHTFPSINHKNWTKEREITKMYAIRTWKFHLIASPFYIFIDVIGLNGDFFYLKDLFQALNTGKR